MATTTPINGLPVPDDDSPNSPPIHFQALADILDKRLVSKHATTTARNNAITAPTDGDTAAVAGYPTVYRGGAWRGLQALLYNATTVDTTTYTASHAVMSVNIPDPQFPYKLEVYGSVLMAQIHAGVTVRGYCQVNGAVINPKGINVINSSGSTITNQMVQAGGPGVSATLTGASTVEFFISKDAGAAGSGFKAAGGADQFWVLSAKVFPV